jgi:hypothetical protein
MLQPGYPLLGLTAIPQNPLSARSGQPGPRSERPSPNAGGLVAQGFPGATVFLLLLVFLPAEQGTVTGSMLRENHEGLLR